MLANVMIFLMQTASPESAPIQCELRAEEAEQQVVLVGGCGASRVFLKPNGKYKIVKNDRSGAVAVAISDEDDSKILVLRPDKDGKPVLEDLTDEILIHAGLDPRDHPSDISFELSDFAADGVIHLSLTDSRTSIAQFVVANLAVVEEQRRSKFDILQPVIPIVDQDKSAGSEN